ncbi:hypothetical protein CTV99_13435 [Bacillus pumilus]|uniref:Uncharacterized protein n=1 Tax=Bacillus pumilus TaxID=1408 RepID=A0A2G8IRU3_BACPU|nr:hypothetical protein CTV99_13435 [Bacillus pumilus]
MSILRAGAHESQIRSAPVLVLPRLQGFSITLKRRQRAKIKVILAPCQQSERSSKRNASNPYLLQITNFPFFSSSKSVKANS